MAPNFVINVYAQASRVRKINLSKDVFMDQGGKVLAFLLSNTLNIMSTRGGWSMLPVLSKWEF